MVREVDPSLSRLPVQQVDGCGYDREDDIGSINILGQDAAEMPVTEVRAFNEQLVTQVRRGVLEDVDLGDAEAFVVDLEIDSELGSSYAVFWQRGRVTVTLFVTRATPRGKDVAIGLARAVDERL